MGICISADEVFDYDAELMRDKKSFSVEVKGDEIKDRGPIRRHKDFADRLIDAPYDGKTDEQKCATIWYAFQRGVQMYGDNKCVGMRAREIIQGDRNGIKGVGPYKWMSYKQASAECVALGAGLTTLGLKTGDAVGICSANRPEWTMSALANYSQAIITVALYDTLGAEAVEYILNHAEIRVAFCSSAKIKQILSVADKCPNLKYIIQYDVHPVFGHATDAIAEGDRKVALEKRVELVGYSELLERGRQSQRGPQPATSDQLAFIMYTSGTTGQPKGAMLTHGNVMACVGGVVRVVALRSADSHLSYLPLAHIFETAVQAAMMGEGAAIAFFSGAVKTLVEDIKELKPTVFAGVPRVFARFHENIMAKVNGLGGIKKAVILNNITKQKHNARRGLPFDPTVEKRMKLIRTAIGLDCCRLMVTGAAPMPPYLMEFLKVVINPSEGVVQGYGMTETAAAVSISWSKDHNMGHVGPPLPSAEICLRDVPDMNYLHTDVHPRGEVLARGPSIFRGYFKNDQATKETLEDGWIATGDVGRWNPNGTLSIIDRKKNMFKLAQGEYVAAEKIEAQLVRAPLVGQLWVYGNSYKTFVVGVVVINPEQLFALAKEKGWWGADDAPLGSQAFRDRYTQVVNAHRDELAQMTKTNCDALAQREGLLAFERPRDYHIESEIDDLMQGFNVANDCLTPTFKLRRPFLLRRYMEPLRALYTKHGEAPTADEKW